MDIFNLRINPLIDYKPPKIPTFKNNNSALLKKIPSRWRKNVSVIVGMGVFGVLALSGRDGFVDANRDIFPHGIVHNLEYTQGSYRGYSEANMLVRLHTGGMGSSFYMVHLTEQEAFGIVRARLEAAGLNFDATPPPSIVSGPIDEEFHFGFSELLFMGRSDGIEFDLYDAQKGVAVTYVRPHHRSFGMTERDVVRRIDDIFMQQDDIIVGAFHNPGRAPDRSVRLPRLLRRPLPWEVTAQRPIIVRQLINQADIFIAHLQSEGILERFPDINVTINGAPFNHGEYPILVNNHKMVPALELFEALEMDIVEDDFGSHRAYIATKNNIEIRASGSNPGFNRGANITINRNPNVIGNRDWLVDTPAIMHNDAILIPLQFVADLAGATIEWIEDTQTIEISY